MFGLLDPFNMLVGLSGLATVGKALKPVAERFEMIDRYNKATEEFKKKNLKLAMRQPVLADNERNMQAHAQRMANGGFNLADKEANADFVEDMRVQLNVGQYADKVLRDVGCVCGKCGQTITNPEQIDGGGKRK